MDEGQTEILKGIRQLRAKAAEQLSGNEYYMVVQQLDTLEHSPELGGDLAGAFVGLIRSRLDAGSLGSNAASSNETLARDESRASELAGSDQPGSPEVPSPDDAPSGSEAPATMDSAVQPDVSSASETPSPSTSAQPATPLETQGMEASEDTEKLITPRANSFGMPQATGAINMMNAETMDTETSVETDETVSEDLLSPMPSEIGSAAMPNVPPQSALSITASAVRQHIVQRLHDNDFYMAGNLLDQLRDLPQPGVDSEAIFPSGDLNAALTLLREQIHSLSGSVQDEAKALMAALDNIISPNPEPAAELEAEPLATADNSAGTDAPASSEMQDTGRAQTVETAHEESEVPQAADASQEENETLQTETETREDPTPAEVDLSSAPDPISEPGPRTGFDDLADAAWHRVKDVDKAERTPPPGLNGRTAPEAVAAATNPAEQTVQTTELEAVEIAEKIAAPAPTPEPVDLRSEDKAEALTDGGSERRSSEPNTAGAEPDHAGIAADAGPEPAFKTQIEGWTETRSKAAQPPETETIKEPGPEHEFGVNEMAGDDLRVEKIGSTDTTESTLRDDIRDRDSRQQQDTMMDAQSKMLADKMDEAIHDAEEALSSEIEVPVKTETSSPLPEDMVAQTETNDSLPQKSKGGFLRRLFGMRAAEYR